MIGLELLAAHMVGDYILQNDWMANRKQRSTMALLAHCLLYTMCFLPFLEYARTAVHAGLFSALLLLSHAIIDHRRWTLGSTWPPKALMIDQTLHIVVLAILARFCLVMP